MMHNTATTVAAYLKELPADRRQALTAVREVILAHLPKGYEETMQYGIIGYVVPLSQYPEGYLGKKDVPLPYVSLASQKNHMAVYLTNVYSDPDIEAWFRAEYEESGKKMDMRKSCVRFKELEDLPLALIGAAVAKTPVDDWIALYKQSRRK